ncbi:MAG: AbrB/MazE/SpoVT family DNA-binding domain-containing protein [Acidobacteriota bacterium]|nr:AbrB/MazE/SpoVT family DNA-binding domain-containing protein [Acidobacteriota bacterium]
MKRKLVQAGSSLAVTLPAEVVHAFRLEKGQEVDVTIHPVSGAVIVRAGTLHFEGGEVTPRFGRTVASLLKRRAAVYRTLAK